jgi:beta-ribofuranosylaminobenzene 5'-phosphate synthase
VGAKLSFTSKLMHIVARPRIHVSLADMGFASLRSFGGIGFSIEQPLTVFQFEPCNGVEIHGLEMLDEEGRVDLTQAIERMMNDRRGLKFRAVLRAAPPQHVGFGTKTALALALIAGVIRYSNSPSRSGSCLVTT